MFTVQDGARELKFEGELVSTSSSKGRNKFRWVQFELYKTAKGRYVLSRVGVSIYYHHAGCAVVKRNGILAVPAEAVSVNLVPCADCRPVRSIDEELYPESPRYWAQVFETAEGVISSLKKYDENGTEYLTDVARRLLTDAADKDDNIYDAFYVEYID